MYDRRRERRDKYDHIKCVLAGDSGVGKTCIMMRYNEDRFVVNPTATLGPDFCTKTVDLEGGKTVRLQVWDTAGQERFRTISVAYFRAAKGIIVVYDVTRRDSFDNVDKWMKEIEERAPEDAICFLVGNKIDLKNRVVHKSEGMEKAEEYGMHFFETSAQSGENVTRLFTEMARAASDQPVLVSAPEEPTVVHIEEQQSPKKHKKSTCC